MVNVGVPRVEFERDPAGSHVESEFAKGAAVDFPAAVPLFQVIVGNMFNRFGDGQVLPRDVGTAPAHRCDFDGGGGKLNGVVSRECGDISDLAAVVAAVELNDHLR